MSTIRRGWWLVKLMNVVVIVIIIVVESATGYAARGYTATATGNRRADVVVGSSRSVCGGSCSTRGGRSSSGDR